jgi:hypothetical protein
MSSESGQSVIRLWKYETAPQDLKNLRRFPTGRTWVLQAPGSLATELEAFLDLSQAAVTSRHTLGDGSLVLFGRFDPRTSLDFFHEQGRVTVFQQTHGPF